MTAGRIGVFDSGVGGLSVLREIRRLLPGADLSYLADQAMAPYGERTLGEVRQRAVAVATHLVGQGARLIVVACNSASAAALHHLRAVVPGVAFVGMEPAVKPAALSSRSAVVGVLATEATFQGELFASVIDRHARDVAVIARACPGLARAVEDLDLSDPELHRLLASYVRPVVARGADVLVLGCTHYAFVAHQVADIAGDGVTVIDPGPAVARHVAAVAEELGLAAGRAELDLATTGDPNVLAAQVQRLLGWVRPNTRSVAIEVDGVDRVVIGETAVRVVRGDITGIAVDAIVNAANEHLAHGGGVAAAIAAAGAPDVEDGSRRWIAEHGPLRPGSAAVTSAGGMPADIVVHVAGPVYIPGGPNEALLGQAVVAALEAASSAGARSIALPAISAGIFGYPSGEATSVIVRSIADWLGQHPAAIEEVVLVGFGGDTSEGFRKALQGLRPG